MTQTANIDPTAIIAPGVVIPDSTQVGPYSTIGEGCVIGEHCHLVSHVVLKPGTHLADHVLVDSFSALGGDPQSLSFDPTTPSGVRIGAHTVIREHVSIHRATEAGALTEIGEHCLIMAGAHIGHDCVLGKHVVMVNGSMLGGFVTLEDYVFVGGNAGLHQNIRIGESVMISGRAGLTMDIPPFTLCSERTEIHGLNLVGLKRRGFATEEIAEIKALYQQTLGTPGNIYKHAEAASAQTPAGERYLAFFQTRGKKGMASYQQARRDRND